APAAGRSTRSRRPWCCRRSRPRCAPCACGNVRWWSPPASDAGAAPPSCTPQCTGRTAAGPADRVPRGSPSTQERRTSEHTDHRGHPPLDPPQQGLLFHSELGSGEEHLYVVQLEVMLAGPLRPEDLWAAADALL